MSKFRIAHTAKGCIVLHEVDGLLTEVRVGMEEGRILSEDEAVAYVGLLEEKGLGTPCPPARRA